MDVKQEVISEISSRIHQLKEHEMDHRRKPCEGNEYIELNHAVSGIIGATLEKELENLRSFVEEL